jgi:hypothetical protein
MTAFPDTGRRGPTINTNSSELAHASIGQWGAVIAGILAGFAAAVLMTTLGTAIGITTGQALAPDAASGASADPDALAGLGIGAAVWLVLTAIVVGLVGGSVLAHTSRPDRPYHPTTLGFVTWAGGIALAVLLAASGAMGLLGSLGGAATATAARQPFAGAAEEFPAAPAVDPALRPEAGTATTEAQREELALVAERAAKTAAMAAWLALIGQVVALLCTIGAAKWQRRRVLEQLGVAAPSTAG